jgi:hypothetical protein
MEKTPSESAPRAFLLYLTQDQIKYFQHLMQRHFLHKPFLTN